MKSINKYHKSSAYNCIFDIDDQIILFNSLHGTICEIPNEVKDCLARGELDKVDDETKTVLSDLGFLVSGSADEFGDYCKQFEESKKNQGILAAKIFLATSCNLGCQYCYQGAPNKSGKSIGDSEVTRLLKWLSVESKNTGVTGLNIEFYGGEPLLAKRQLRNLLVGISEIARINSLSVSYLLVTNGTLLDNTTIDLLLANRVEMQITLDGSRAVHDNRRFWKGTRNGSYDAIVANLSAISLKGGSDLVEIRMNVDRNNITDVANVAEQVRNLGFEKFYCGQIHFRGRTTPYSGEIITETQFDETFDLEIFRELRRFGFGTIPSSLACPGTCLYHWHHGFAISPTLDLFKCDELIFYPEHRVGWIDDKGISQIDDVAFDKAVSRNPRDFADCHFCKYLPQCASGCPVRALNAKGSPHLSFCEVSDQAMRARVANYIRAQEP